MPGREEFLTEYSNFDDLYKTLIRLSVRTRLNDSYYDNTKLL